MGDLIEIPCKYGTLVAKAHYEPDVSHTITLLLRRADGEEIQCATLEAPFDGDAAELVVFDGKGKKAKRSIS